jgi:hypothetical protein
MPMLTRVPLLLVLLAACGPKASATAPLAPTGTSDRSPLAMMPADTALVAHVDVRALVKTQLWQKFSPLLLGDPEVKEMLAFAREKCQLDLVNDIAWVTIAMNDRMDEERMVVLVDGNFDEAKLVACASAHAEQQGLGKVAASSGGGMTTLMLGSGEKISFGWATPHTLVLTPTALHGNDPTFLASLLGDGPSALDNAELVGVMGKVRPDATMWLAAHLTEELARQLDTDDGPQAKAVWANLNIDAQQNLTVQIAGRMASADDARAAADMGQQAWDQFKQHPDAQEFVDAVKIHTSGDEVVFELALTSAQIDHLIDLAIQSLR